jgi:hypothetical protein
MYLVCHYTSNFTYYSTGGIESSKIAIAIEDALWQKHNGTKEYAQKFRMLYSNIKDEKNHALRKALFSFQLSADEVTNLTHDVRSFSPLNPKGTCKSRNSKSTAKNG